MTSLSAPRSVSRIAAARALAAVALVAGSCAPGTDSAYRAEPPTSAGAVALTETEQLRETLAEIADAIDPGAQPPLTTDMPSWLLAALGVEGAATASAARAGAIADAETKAWRDNEGTFADTAAVLAGATALARAVIYGERAAAAGASDADQLARMQRVYSALDTPIVASERGVIGQVLQQFVAAVAAKGRLTQARQMESLGEFVFGALRRAGALHLRTVALLLRADPAHPGVARALADAARGVRRDDEALAVRVATLSVKLRGADVEAKHWIALARLCHRALDLDCGTRALAQAAMVGARAPVALNGETRDVRPIERAQAEAALAGRVVALTDDTGLDARLERARGLMALDRVEGALSAYEALRRDYPTDARPVSGLARHAVQTRFDVAAANALIDGAGPLQNRDSEYFQIAIGTRAVALFADAIPRATQGDWARAMVKLTPALARMQTDIAGYEALGSSDGRYLRFVIEQAMVMLPVAQAGDHATLREMLRDMLPRAVALLAEIPDNEHAYRLVMAATQFSADRSAALAAALRPIPQDAELAIALTLRRLQALTDLTVTWGDAEIAVALRRAAQEAEPVLPTAMARALLDARAVSGRLLGEVPWAELAVGYRIAVGDVAQSTDASGLNNLALALAEAGDLDAARPLWARVAEMGRDAGDAGDVAKLNLAVWDTGESRVRALAELAERARPADVRVAARRWLLDLASGGTQRARAREALRTTTETERATFVRPTLLAGRIGASLEGNLNVQLGYSVKVGLQLQLDSVSTLWLTRPVPVAPRGRRRH